MHPYLPEPLTLCLQRSASGRRLAVAALAAGLGLASCPAAQAQDLYFAQPYATRLHTNPAFAGLLDDYSITLSYRNQFPTLAGTFQTGQLAADYRFADQHSAAGLLLNTDRSGQIGYTRLEVGGIYAYHTRLTGQFSLSGGLHAAYGHQRISYANLVFGDQLAEDGRLTGPSAEPLDLQPVSYLTLGTGLILYNDNFWVSTAAHHVNQPDLGFATQTRLPLRLNLSGGIKHFFLKKTEKQVYREISLSPTASYTRQGGSPRAEVGLYGTITPIMLGAVYRGVPLPGASQPQQILTAVVGANIGALRLGYSYDLSLSQLSADLGGAHEVTLSVRQFDSLEAAWRRLKRRNYPSIPCPAF
ncbi:type IX secretion system membrane protein, PorP/SprF family [Hymenobacter daecheongensis DSM 21074]|uniref:Type IX secretion system membrane protein, PorP/SprF family n=1 Tax=Hymenobacter daecheongensis DSM 21074 TaxID=1121955 RepID=A0A1M6AWW0_9BACT|nr:PorP/SprF family type IX secretion system membrane protein [Hymenobacter daecheongensis]SHI40984.1 type IX secretion system membrane protein, PorP/SprF family [Hymenobacter daecheongensis DSM 21074]